MQSFRAEKFFQSYIRLATVSSITLATLLSSNAASASELLCEVEAGGRVVCTFEGEIVASGSVTPGTELDSKPGFAMKSRLEKVDLTLNHSSVFGVGGDGTGAVSLMAGSGGIRLRALGDFRTEGGVSADNEYSDAITAITSDGGSIDAAVGNIETLGDESFGVFFVSSGDTALSVGNILTQGDYSNGVYVSSAGDTSVSCGNIQTNGASSHGIFLRTGGAATIRCGNIAVVGDRASAVWVYDAERADVVVGDILDREKNRDAIRIDARGDISLVAGDLTIGGGVDGRSGHNNTAIRLRSQNFGTVDVGFGDIKIESQGLGPNGVDVIGGQVNVSGGDISISTTDGGSKGVYLVAQNGARLSLGDIAITGDASSGVFLRVSNGLELNSGAFSLRGNDGMAIYVESFDSAEANVIKTGSISAFGDRSRGAYLYGRLSEFSLIAGDLDVVGDQSIGIEVWSPSDTKPLNARIATGLISVSGSGSKAVWGHQPIGSLDVEIGGATVDGISTDALLLTTGQGDIKLLSLGDVVSKGGSSIVARTLSGSVRIDLRGDVHGTSGIIVEQSQGANLRLAGRVTAASGPAISVTGGASNVEVAAGGHVLGSMVLDTQINKVMVRSGGIVDFTDLSVLGSGSAKLTNEGSINFHAGSQLEGVDHILNGVSGVISVERSANSSFTTSILENFGTLGFSGKGEISLTKGFLNSGAISTSNGVAGDMLRVSGWYNAQGHATLELNYGQEKTDKIVFDGRLSGTTTVLINSIGTIGFDASGISVIEAPNADDDSFRLDGGQGTAFVDFSLVRHGNSFDVLALPSQNALRPISVLPLVREGWRQSSDAIAQNVSSDEAQSGIAFWSNAYGANVTWQDVGPRLEIASSTSGGQSADANFFGVQFGNDLSHGVHGTRVGWTVGYQTAGIKLGSQANLQWAETANVGFYAAIDSATSDRSGFSASVVLKRDWTGINFVDLSMGPVSSKVMTSGANGRVSYKLKLGRNTAVELGLGLQYLWQSVDRFDVENIGYYFSTFEAGNSSVGLRVKFADNPQLFVGLAGHKEFAAKGRAILHSSLDDVVALGRGQGDRMTFEAGFEGSRDKVPLYAAVWGSAGTATGFGIRAGIRF